MSRSFATNADHLDLASAPVLAPPMTLAAWIKISGSVLNTEFVTIGTSGSAANLYALMTLVGASAQARERDAGAASGANSTFTLDVGNWRLIVGTFLDHTNRACYTDGANKGTVSALKAATTPNMLRISGDPQATPVNPFVGLIAHVAVWNVALTDADVLALLTLAPPAIRPDALLEYWPLVSGQPTEPGYGQLGDSLVVTGTTFSYDNPPIGLLPGAIVGQRLQYSSPPIFQL